MKKIFQKIMEDKVLSAVLAVEALIVLYLLIKAFAGGASNAAFLGDVFFDNIKRFETVSEDGSDVVIKSMPAEQQADLEHGINIYSGKFALRSGGYIMTVKYESEGGETIEYMLPANGYVGLRSVLKDGSAIFEPLYLDDLHDTVSGRLYIPAFSSVDDLQLFIHYDGPGPLRISSVTIEEKRVYRFMQIAGFLFCFAIFDLLYFLLISPLYKKSDINMVSGKGRRILISVLTVIFASMPLFIGYLYKGHDLMFHLNRIEAIASAMRYHKLPVRIQSDLLLGYGYSIPLYYCDIFLYPSAFFYEFCMVPLRICYQGYVLAMNILTAYLSYRCFRTIFKDENMALMGMAMYTLSAYRLIDIYLRAAAGEYTAVTFIPLVLEGVYRIYTAEKIRANDWIPLSLGMAGLIQSHIVSTIIVGFFIFLFVVFMIKKLTPARIAAFIEAAVLSLFLTLWFLVPMLESMATQNPVVTELSNRIQWTGIYLTQLFEILPGGDGISREGTYRDMPLGIGAGLLFALILLVIYTLTRNIDKERDNESVNSKVLNISFFLGLLALWMSTVYFPRDIISRILIGRLDSIRSVWEVMELVWRHMIVAVMLLVTAFIALLVVIRERKRSFYRPVIVIAAVLTVISDLSFYQGIILERGQDTYIQMDNDKQAYLDMSGDYDLVWGMTRQITDGSVVTSGKGMTVESYEIDGADRIVALTNKGEAGEAMAPLFDYGNYHAFDTETGAELITSRDEETARLKIGIPASYKGSIRISYISPVYWRIAEIISLLTWIILAVYGIYLSRRSGSSSKA